MKLSQRAQGLKPSPTLALVAKAKELAAAGKPIISLTVGEPDWDTFPLAAQAGIDAIKSGTTRYTPAQGTVELRKAIAKNFKKEVGIDYSPSQISVASGAKFIIFAALQVLVDPGDEVVMGAPYWVSYPTMIELAGGKPCIVECNASTQYKLLATDLKKAITSRTKAFLFCSPSNPTGLAYSKSELMEIAEVLRQNPHVAILSDDMYNRLMFDGSDVAPHILHVAPDLQDRTIVINGGSKTYAMTGWRIGWAGGPLAIITAMADYQSQATGCPPSIAQQAALVAIEKCQDDVRKTVLMLTERKQKALSVLKEIPGYKVSEPDGAFYFWVDIKQCLGKKYKGKLISNSKDYCAVLLDDYYVATVPGSECGTEGFMRLSFATELTQILSAFERMRELNSQLV